jgi:hypothetical protein
VTTSVEDPAEPLLARMTPDTRALVQELRPLILDVVPQAAEKVHLGWSVLHYKTGPSMKDVLFALVPHRAWVNLEFGDGVDLPDPAQRLEGTGKRLRHVKIRTSEDVNSPDVRTLLEVAAKHRGL